MIKPRIRNGPHSTAQLAIATQEDAVTSTSYHSSIVLKFAHFPRLTYEET